MGVEITWSPADGEAQPLTTFRNAVAPTGLTNGTQYTFTVVTVDTAGNRSAGTTVTATPVATTLDYMSSAAQAEVNGSQIYGFDMGVNYWDHGSTYQSDVQLYSGGSVEDGYISFDLVDTTSSTAVEPGLYTANPGSTAANSINWVRFLAGDLDTATDTFDYVARFEDEPTASGIEFFNWLVYDQIIYGTVNVTEDSGVYTFDWTFQTARGTTLSGSHTGTPWP
jgi:hypothetical protein